MMINRQELEALYGDLKSESDSYRQDWKILGENFVPRSTRFLDEGAKRNKPTRNTKIINNTPTIVARTLAEGLSSIVSNPSRKWFAMRHPDTAINDEPEVKEILAYIQDLIASTFVKSNIYSVLSSIYEDLGVFATGCCIILEDPDTYIRAYHFPVGSYVLGCDERGKVNQFFRERDWTASQLVKKFGIENVSTQVKNAYESKRYNQYFPCVNAIVPNFEPKGIGPHSKPFLSVYFESGNQEKDFLGVEGFNEFPVLAPRWKVCGEDTYGTGPGWDAVGAAIGLQLLEKRAVQGLEKNINPPKNIPVQMKSHGPVSLLPGAENFTDGANVGVTPAHQPNPYLNEIREFKAQAEQQIKDAFYYNLFLMMTSEQRSNITAAEINARLEEKGILTSVVSHLNDELYDPLIERTFSILQRRGLIPPVPEELGGGELTIEYISVFHQAQKIGQINGITQLMQFVGAVGQLEPSSRHKFDAFEAIDTFADAAGVKPSIVRSDEVAGQMVAAEQAALAKQQQMQAAVQMADTAKTLSETNVDQDSMLQQLGNVVRGGAM